MNMTNEEIVASYKAAKSPQKQISVLADLNVCKKQEIVAVLLAAGEKVPGNFLPKPKKQPVERKAEPEESELTVFKAMEILQTLSGHGFRDLLLWIGGTGNRCTGYQVLLRGDKPESICLMFEEG